MFGFSYIHQDAREIFPPNSMVFIKMTNISHQCDQLRNDENTFIKCQYDILKIKKSLI